MGECTKLLTPSFNRSVQVEGRDERLGTAGGAVLLREIMQLSGLWRFLANRLQDPRRQAAIWTPPETRWRPGAGRDSIALEAG